MAVNGRVVCYATVCCATLLENIPPLGGTGGTALGAIQCLKPRFNWLYCWSWHSWRYIAHNCDIFILVKLVFFYSSWKNTKDMCSVCSTLPSLTGTSCLHSNCVWQSVEKYSLLFPLSLRISLHAVGCVFNYLPDYLRGWGRNKLQNDESRGIKWRLSGLHLP